MPRQLYPFERIGTTQGPWPCERCGGLSQFCDVGLKLNRVYCMNEGCRFLRIIDKASGRIMEDDGTQWEYNSNGEKTQVRPR
jgi:hypothetical protein